ncbi:MAG: hypothetical protein DWP97_08320 [Calditrichaeota bacterium]|nr:MAG: hypothetical protein DWP97_08320 [Calditrichota bacterium]
MDIKDSKTQKIILGVLALVIVCYFWYSRLYTVNSSQIEMKNREFETITTNLRNVEMKAKSLDALKLEYKELLANYNEIEELLPEVKQIPSFLVQLHTASSLTGTKITKIQPLASEVVDFYNVVSFEVELDGTYHDFGKFISYVANFPFITNVSDVTLTAKNVSISESAAKEKDQISEIKKEETMTAVFRLSTYYVLEEERLQELNI